MTHLSLATSTTLFGNTVLQQLVVCEQALTERPRELAKFFAPCKSSLDTTHTIASPQTSFGVRSSRIHFERVTNKPQRKSAGSLLIPEKLTVFTTQLGYERNFYDSRELLML